MKNVREKYIYFVYRIRLQKKRTCELGNVYRWRETYKLGGRYEKKKI